MSFSNGDLFSNCESTPCIQKNSAKRSLSKTTENDHTTNDTHCKKKKLMKHSQDEINNAVCTASNGYMTRNKLKRQQSNYNEFESIDKSPKHKINNNISKKAKRIRNRKNPKDKFQPGYVFTHDVSSSYNTINYEVKHKKSSPSLFESDSELEIEIVNSFPPMHDNFKDEVKKSPVDINNSEYSHPAFSKNIEVKTYSKKKSCAFNNIPVSNTIEKNNQWRESLSLHDEVINANATNLCENILQNGKKPNNSLKLLDPTPNVCPKENSSDDESLMVTEEFIRQLEKEFTTERKVLQDESRTQDTSSGITIPNSNNELPNNNLVVSYESEIPSIEYDNSAPSVCIKENINGDENLTVTEEFIRQLENELQTEKNVLQDESRTQDTSYGISVPYSNNKQYYNNLVVSHKSEIPSVEYDNESRAQVTSYGISVPKTNNEQHYNNLVLSHKSEIPSVEYDYPTPSICLNENGNDESLYVTKEDTRQLEQELIMERKVSLDHSVEHCRISEKRDNKEDNKNDSVFQDKISSYVKTSNLVTNKYFHTDVNTNIKSISHLINQDMSVEIDNSNKFESKKPFSKCQCKHFYSLNRDANKILTSKSKHFVFNNGLNTIRQKMLREKNLEANALKMLITKNNKYMNHSKKLIPSINLFECKKNNDKCINVNEHIEPNILSMLKDVYVGVEYLSENLDYKINDNKLPKLQTITKNIEINIQASNKNSVDSYCLNKSDEIISPSITTKNTHYIETSNITTKNQVSSKKFYDESGINFKQNEKKDNHQKSNVTKINDSLKSSNENYFNFENDKEIVIAHTSNITPKHNTPNILNSRVEKTISLEENKSYNDIYSTNITNRDKPHCHKLCNENDSSFEETKISNDINVSNNAKEYKHRNLKTSDEDDFINIKNENEDNHQKSNVTKINDSLKSCNENYFNFEKNKEIVIAYASNITPKYSTPNILNSCVEKTISEEENKSYNDIYSTNVTNIDKSHLCKLSNENDSSFEETKNSIDINVSKNTKKFKPHHLKNCVEHVFSCKKNEKKDNHQKSNDTKLNDSIKLSNKNYFNFENDKEIVIAHTSNITPKHNTPNILNSRVEKTISLEENNSYNDVYSTNVTNIDKPHYRKLSNESDSSFEETKSCNDINVSNNTEEYKHRNLKISDEDDFINRKNENEDNHQKSNVVKINDSLKLSNENYFNFENDKEIVIAHTSNITSKHNTPNILNFRVEKSISLEKNKSYDDVYTTKVTNIDKPHFHKPCNENYLSFQETENSNDINVSNNTEEYKQRNLKISDEDDFINRKNENEDNHEKSNVIKINDSLKLSNENYFNFENDKEIVIAHTSNITSKHNTPNILNSCVEKSISLEKNKNDDVYTTKVTNIDKPHFLKLCNENYLSFEETENSNSIDVSNINKKYKHCNLITSDENYFINGKNEKNKNDQLILKTMSYKKEIEKKIYNYNQPNSEITPADKNNSSSEVSTFENQSQSNKLLEPPHYKNIFDTSDFEDNISSDEDNKLQIDTGSLHIHEQSNESLYDHYNSEYMLNISSDDDYDDGDNKLQMEDDKYSFDNCINSKSACTFINDSKDSLTTTGGFFSDTNILNRSSDLELCEDEPINAMNKQSIETSINKEYMDFQPVLIEEKSDLFSNKHKNVCVLKEENSSLTDCMDMTIEMCNAFYKNRSFNSDVTDSKNEYFKKNIKDIFTEMYVDQFFVSSCQHMVEFHDDVQLKNDNMYSQLDGKHKKENLICDIKIKKEDIQLNNDNIYVQPDSKHKKENLISNIKIKKDDNQIYPEINKSIPANVETIFKEETKKIWQQKNNNKLTIPTTNVKELNCPENKSNSNMKIRIQLREFVKSGKSVNEIIESKEFRKLRFFKEEEIASSIGVLIFESTFDSPVITGLSTYRINFDQLNNDEKIKLLGSTNLNITYPKIMKFTTITLALVKMLRSDTLVNLILNVIRKNLLNKKMNTNHTIDHQLITQTVYFVDICLRLRLLKTLQTFIFDSMVILPNKYCCVIFISLLLWKNCLPKRVDNEKDPVIITAISYLIAKKKFYSEQTVGCDIFQRELINLLSFHFNYSFSIDLPFNFIQNINKPDFYISVVMFLKCCNPKDLVEFMVSCLFPIIENYLNTQQNETCAVKILELISMAIKPFKISCNTTIATYLNKCKSSINISKKDEKEHIYNTIYSSYKSMQNKFIQYFNDSRMRSQSFDESLVSIIMLLGSVDYLTSCETLMKWKPKYERSTIISKKFNMFKSILGHVLWDELCDINDTKVVKCLVNSCLLKKDVFNTIIRLQAIR